MTSMSRKAEEATAPRALPRWSFLTNHARVLLCLAEDPDMRLREVGERVGITERAAHRIVGELEEAGYISRSREGRRNRYTIHGELALPDPLARDHRVGDLIDVLVGRLSSRAG
jgi:predicted ArsR family transcriptional regulator